MIRWGKPALAALCWSVTTLAAAQDLESPTATAGAQDSPAEQAPESFADPAPVETTPTIPVEPLAATAEPETLSEPGSAAQLDDIIVTSTKRSQSVREIPVSITALTGDKLEQIGAQELKDFIRLVPGINSQDEIAGIQRKLSVRGVGPDTGTNQTVGTVYGDVPLSDPYGSFSIADPGPWDLQTVEVLKGPQGTLFGATSLAGVIRYVPNNPELGRWSGRFSADWVSVEDGTAEPTFGAVLNAPIGDSVAVRLSGSWQHKPGYIDIDNPSWNEKDAEDAYSRTARAMLLWQPNDRFSLNAWHVRGGREAQELGYLTNPEAEPLRDDAVAPSPVDNRYTLNTLDARYEFDWATLVSITGYQTKYSFNDTDTSYLVRPLARLGIRTIQARRTVDTSGWLQELRLVSPDDGPWTWLAGAFYSTYTADVSAALYINPDLPLFELLPPGLLGLPIDEHGIKVPATSFHPLEASEQALFGELTRSFGDHWSATLGGRLYRAGVDGTPDGETEALTSDGQGFSPKASVSYRFDRDLMLYATVARGFQYGGFNLGGVGPNTDPPTFKSSTLISHELGLRSDWLDRTLRFDLTALYVLWKNPQVRQVSTVNGVTNPAGSFTDNVGEVRSYGAESTLRYITPLPGLTLETSAAYIVAKTTVPYENSTGETIAEGTEMPSSPRLQTSSTLSYALGFGNWMTYTALTHTFQGATYNNIEHDVEVGDYHLYGLNFTLSRIDLRLAPSLSIGVSNLTDERAPISALGGSDTIPGFPELSQLIVPRPYVFTQPRTLRLNLTLNFE
ncbi:MAG TPA: TonB-dependent receptor [Fontimonas sp.]